MRKPGMVTLLAAALALLLCGDTGTADAAAVPVAGDDPRAFVPMWLRGRYFLDNDGNKLYNATKDKPLGKQILTLGRLVRSTAFFPIAKTKTDGNGVFDFRFTATPDGTFQVRNSKDSAVSTFDWPADDSHLRRHGLRIPVAVAKKTSTTLKIGTTKTQATQSKTLMTSSPTRMTTSLTTKTTTSRTTTQSTSTTTAYRGAPVTFTFDTSGQCSGAPKVELNITASTTDGDFTLMLGNPRNHSFIPGTPGFFCDGDGVFVGTTSNWAAPRAFDFGIVSTNTSFNNFRFENYTFGYYESAISSNTFNVSTSKDNPNWGGTVALREPIPILEKGKMVTLEYNDWCNNTSNMTTCLPSNSFFVQFKYLVFVPTFY